MAERISGKYTLTLSSNIVHGGHDNVQLLIRDGARDFIFIDPPDDERVAKAVMDYISSIDERDLLSEHGDREVAVIAPGWRKIDCEFWGYEVLITVSKKARSDYDETVEKTGGSMKETLSGLHAGLRLLPSFGKSNNEE